MSKINTDITKTMQTLMGEAEPLKALTPTEKEEFTEDLMRPIIFSISLPGIYKHKLTRHFKKNGLSIMAGCRVALIEYMKNEGLL